MKEPKCFQCQEAMKYLGESFRSIKVRVNKGERPRKERRWYNIWYCENSHPKREHYTKGKPQRYTIQIFGQILAKYFYFKQNNFVNPILHGNLLF